MSRYEILYLLCMIAIGSWIAVWMFFDWQQIIFAILFLLGFGFHNELPYFLDPLEHLVKLFAIIFLLMIIHMDYHIEDYAERIREEGY